MCCHNSAPRLRRLQSYCNDPMSRSSACIPTVHIVSLPSVTAMSICSTAQSGLKKRPCLETPQVTKTHAEYGTFPAYINGKQTHRRTTSALLIPLPLTRIRIPTLTAPRPQHSALPQILLDDILHRTHIVFRLPKPAPQRQQTPTPPRPEPPLDKGNT